LVSIRGWINLPITAALRATREGLADALLELGRENENVVVLDADLSKSTGTARFAKEFPNRFFNCGIAEQSMMDTAAGLAASGKIVYTGSFSIFATGRAYEQIRNTIGYTQLPVKICPTHGGVTVGEDGASHQTFEDIALMRVIPGMSVIVPADYWQAKEAVKTSADIAGCAFIRLGRPPIPLIYNEEYKFKFGKADILRKGRDVTVVACGSMVAPVLEAAEQVEKDIDVEVINMHTIKPLDQNTLLESAKKTGMVITVEEHSVIGGLGGAVAETLSEKLPVTVKRIGIPDTFGTSGSPSEILEYFGLTTRHISAAIVNTFNS
jgi:transketolase